MYTIINTLYTSIKYIQPSSLVYTIHPFPPMETTHSYIRFPCFLQWKRLVRRVGLTFCYICSIWSYKSCIHIITAKLLPISFFLVWTYFLSIFFVYIINNVYFCTRTSYPIGLAGYACGWGHGREVGVSALTSIGAQAPKSYWCNESDAHSMCWRWVVNFNLKHS